MVAFLNKDFLGNGSLSLTIGGADPGTPWTYFDIIDPYLLMLLDCILFSTLFFDVGYSLISSYLIGVSLDSSSLTLKSKYFS